MKRRNHTEHMVHYCTVKNNAFILTNVEFLGTGFTPHAWYKEIQIK